MVISKILPYNKISLTPLGNRRFRLNKTLEFAMFIDNTYRLKAYMHKGYVTDFRSGGPLVDKFIDQFGETPEIQCCYLMHDLLYTKNILKQHYKSRVWADELLRAALICAGLPKWKANTVWTAVRMFGGEAYSDDDEYSVANATRFTLYWSPILPEFDVL